MELERARKPIFFLNFVTINFFFCVCDRGIYLFVAGILCEFLISQKKTKKKKASGKSFAPPFVIHTYVFWIDVF
jgi:hypothetical protein